MLAARRDYSPSSSPPSSTGPIDSSPPSSPGYNYAELNAPSIGLTHPFAASAKAVKCPPNYEKDRKKNKRPNSPQLLPDSPSKSKRARYLERRDSVDDVPIPAFPADFSTLSSRCHSPELTLEDIEEQEWDRASAAVIDQVNGSVDLEKKNLTRIPFRFIDDLRSFYVPSINQELYNASPSRSHLHGPPGGRMFTKIRTTPEINELFSGPRMSRENTSSARHREEVRLFLAHNRISRIPIELMDLERMTVLSLWDNKISRLPREIINLVNLHSLNVANNRLKYLPAEILTMRLQALHVHPNPFFRTPFPPSTNGTPTSDILELRSRVTPLEELCLRMLFSPPSNLTHSTLQAPLFHTDNRNSTTLRQRILEIQRSCLLNTTYELPLNEAPFNPNGPPPYEFTRLKLPLPDHLRMALGSCLPGSVYALDEHNADEDESSHSGHSYDDSFSHNSGWNFRQGKQQKQKERDKKRRNEEREGKREEEEDRQRERDLEEVEILLNLGSVDIPSVPVSQSVTAMLSSSQRPLQQNNLHATQPNGTQPSQRRLPQRKRREKRTRYPAKTIGMCPSPRHGNLWNLDVIRKAQDDLAGSTSRIASTSSIGSMLNNTPHSSQSSRRKRTLFSQTTSSLGIYLSHAEERFTWESQVAGVMVGGQVPLKWKGCDIGCLDFLNGCADVREELEKWQTDPTLEADMYEENGIIIEEDKEDVDDDDDDTGVVQTIHLHAFGTGLGRGGGFDEFDDE